jgi:hypothetical protein
MADIFSSLVSFSLDLKLYKEISLACFGLRVDRQFDWNFERNPARATFWIGYSPFTRLNIPCTSRFPSLVIVSVLGLSNDGDGSLNRTFFLDEILSGDSGLESWGLFDILNSNPLSSRLTLSNCRMIVGSDLYNESLLNGSNSAFEDRLEVSLISSIHFWFGLSPIFHGGTGTSSINFMSLVLVSWSGESWFDTIWSLAKAGVASKEALPAILTTLPLGVIDGTSGQKFDYFFLIIFKFSEYSELSPSEIYFFRAKNITFLGFIKAESFESLSRTDWIRYLCIFPLSLGHSMLLVGSRTLRNGFLAA